MLKLIDLLTIVLNLLLRYFDNRKQEDVKREASKTEQSIRSNPRDFFDDGVLNNSDKSSKDGDTIPRTDSTRQP